jgi:hypothetical protein
MLASAILLTAPLLFNVVAAQMARFDEPANLFSFHNRRAVSRAAQKPPRGTYQSKRTKKSSALSSDGKNLTYVVDSGVCETTEGVHQISGYVNVTPDDPMVSLSAFCMSRPLSGCSGSGFLRHAIRLKLLHSRYGGSIRRICARNAHSRIGLMAAQDVRG